MDDRLIYTPISLTVIYLFVYLSRDGFGTARARSRASNVLGDEMSRRVFFVWFVISWGFGMYVGSGLLEVWEL